MSLVINPYHLFGLTIDSSLKDLKKSYYEMSLICHPDRGGDKEQMITVHNSYLYLKEQLSNRCHRDLEDCYQDLEKQFNDFCSQQTEEVPEFNTIYKENNDFIEKFNDMFEQKNTPLEDQLTDDPFKEGYSQFMESSENHINSNCEYPLSDCNQKINNTFQKQIIEYQEPQSLPDQYGSHQNLNISKINDFSHHGEHLEMTDYIKAHSSPVDLSKLKYQEISLEHLIQERDQHEQEFKENQKIKEEPKYFTKHI